jgi:hypothetical protein
VVWLIVNHDPGGSDLEGDAVYSILEGTISGGTISGREGDFVKNDPILPLPILSTIIYTGGYPLGGGEAQNKGIYIP